MSIASDLERQMLELINAVRLHDGLAPVQLELRLNDSAELHSQWMLETDVFSHTGESGSSAGTRMENAGFQFSGSWTWAENIALQSERGELGIVDDVEDLHVALMNSPGHRANILNPNVVVVGIGIEYGEFNGLDVIVVTQNFARTSSELQLDIGSNDSSGSNTTATNGNDILELTAGGLLDGLRGNDELTGSSSDDKLLGRGGTDTLRGMGGNDKLLGNSQSDLLDGGGGKDTLKGGGGRDTLDGSIGNDKLIGNNGADTFVFSSGSDRVIDFGPLGEKDRIDLSNAAGITGFNDLMMYHISEISSDLLVSDDDGNSMRLVGVSVDELSSGDFIF